MGGYIAVVDYHKGNLLSVEQGIDAAGGRALVTDDPAAIVRASGIVVPGVGAFSDAMDYMRASGQDLAVCSAVAAGVPVLGICLGMQLLFDRGNEHACPPEPGRPAEWVEGLGLLGGEVPRMEGRGVKVPHMGWNALSLTPAAARCPLFFGIEDGTYFYFTHSYVCRPEDPSVVVARTEHGVSFASAVWDGGRVFGCQFHPEKSSSAGAVVMRNFVSTAQEG